VCRTTIATNAVLAVPVSGIRLNTDPLDDAILQGLDRIGDDALMVKKSDPEVAGMWFGPRLGRRDRRSADATLGDATDDRLEEILELLKETGWTLVPVRGESCSVRVILVAQTGDNRNATAKILAQFIHKRTLAHFFHTQVMAVLGNNVRHLQTCY
jgi:hypothetical protein